MLVIHRIVALIAHPRSERGLSQSTESAVLLAGAIAVAGIVVAAVTLYVTGHLPK